MLSYPKNKEPHRQPVAQNQSLLSYRRNLTKQSFTHGPPLSVRQSHLDVDLIQHAHQLSQRRHTLCNEPNKHQSHLLFCDE